VTTASCGSRRRFCYRAAEATWIGIEARNKTIHLNYIKK
jgi:hypothetical protein